MPTEHSGADLWPIFRKAFILLPFPLPSLTDLFLFSLRLQIFVCVTSFRGAVCRKPSDGASSVFSHSSLKHNGRRRKKGGQRCRSRSGRRGNLEYRRITICRRETICIELKKWSFMSRKWASAWNSQWHHSWAEWRRAGVRWSGPSWDGMTGLEFYKRGSDTGSHTHTHTHISVRFS